MAEPSYDPATGAYTPAGPVGAAAAPPPVMTTALLAELAQEQGTAEEEIAADLCALMDIMQRLGVPVGQALTEDQNSLEAIYGRLVSESGAQLKADRKRLLQIQKKLNKGATSGIQEDAASLAAIAPRLDRGRFPGAGQVGAPVPSGGYYGQLGAGQQGKPEGLGSAPLGPSPVGLPGTAPTPTSPQRVIDAPVTVMGQLAAGIGGGPFGTGGQLTPPPGLMPGQFGTGGQLSPPPGLFPPPAGTGGQLASPPGLMPGQYGAGGQLAPPLTVPELPPKPPADCPPCEAAMYVADALGPQLQAIARALIALTEAGRAATQAAAASPSAPDALPPLVWVDPPEYDLTEIDTRDFAARQADEFAFLAAWLRKLKGG